MEIGYCLDCKELNYAMTNANGVFERANMSNNHQGHKQYIFEEPKKYSPPICNVLTKLQAGAPISDNEIVLFKLAIDLGNLEKYLDKLLSFCYHFYSGGGERMVQTTIRLPKELYSMLKEKAKRKGLTLNAFLINALWEVAKGN